MRVYEVSARRRDGFDLEEYPPDRGLSDLEVQQTLTTGQFIFRTRIDIFTEKGILRADVATIFETSEELAEPEEEILDEFAHEVGLPNTIPYLRVYVQQAARLIGVPAPLLKHYWGDELKRLELRRRKQIEGDSSENPESPDA
ncbi:hypothetical protein ACH4OY_19510 [Micromonospora rubida]|uniref:Uncharacterized protein n=1 Tax=Micromonospora rubida TaxID=2697657 RepID=A0ABW7SMC3_9ACTN